MRHRLTFALLFLVACNDDPEPPEIGTVGLTKVGQCQDVEARLRADAIREMSLAMQRERKDVLENGVCNYSWGGEYASDAAGAPPPTQNTSGGPRGETPRGSTTNNQVAGVDEADFVKRVDDLLYIAAQGAVWVLDVWPASEMRVVNRFTVEGTPHRLLISGDRRLLVISRKGGAVGEECTYGYFCSADGENAPAVLTVVDVSDPTAPHVMRKLEATGGYVAARRIDGTVHVVLSDTSPRLPAVQTRPNIECGAGLLEIMMAFEVLEEQNRRLLATAPLLRELPGIVERDADGNAGENLLGCSDTWATATQDGSGFTSVLSFALGNDGRPQVTSILSRAGFVMASEDALYLAVSHQRSNTWGWFSGYGDADESTTIHRFQLRQTPPETTYAGSGAVKGHILSQFAMDEHEGHLRVAATEGHAPDPGTRTGVTVFRPGENALEVVGSVDGLAPSEDLRAVRFDGDRGYLVTFKKTDPLFVLDLADPRSPKVRGELKIPGFSTYLHRLGPDHLLSIGYDAEDHDSFAFFQGVLIQVFDVSDATNPTLTWKTVIGTRGSSSEALTNHLAFTFFPSLEDPSDGNLALPMTICEQSSGGGSYGDQMTFSGLMVFHVGAAAGITELGRISHPRGPNATCYNWWTDASSDVQRSFFLGDDVISISETRVKSDPLAALGTGPTLSLTTTP